VIQGWDVQLDLVPHPVLDELLQVGQQLLVHVHLVFKGSVPPHHPLELGRLLRGHFDKEVVDLGRLPVIRVVLVVGLLVLVLGASLDSTP
jgi:hypothetical protein